MTFSIVARGTDGLLGIAVSSRALAVGARCAFVAPHTAALATQGYTHPYLAFDVIQRLHAGDTLTAAAATVLAADEQREWQQLLAIAPSGPPFAHTGAENETFAGHIFGENCVAGGNVLTGADVLEAAVAAFESSNVLAFPERMHAALAAAQARGGDRRGRQSAALLIRGQEQVAYVDLRVDDHPDPVAELGRILRLMGPDERERARWLARTREPRPVATLRAAQQKTRTELTGGG